MVDGPREGFVGGEIPAVVLQVDPMAVAVGTPFGVDRRAEDVTVLAVLDPHAMRRQRFEEDIDADVMCISVGLSPLAELLWQIGCNMKFVPELGGHVPMRSEELQTSIPGIYVAGDVAGVEEASSAMVEGRLAGLCAAKDLGFIPENFEALKKDYLDQLSSLRSGPVGEKICKGLSQLTVQNI
jgi:sarcosine oxidase subunit alpha